MAPQITDKVLVESQAMRAHAPLRVEDACNGRIGVVLCQSPYECKGIFVGTDCGGSRARQRDITLGELATAPAQCQMRLELFATNGKTGLESTLWIA